MSVDFIKNLEVDIGLEDIFEWLFRNKIRFEVSSGGETGTRTFVSLSLPDVPSWDFKTQEYWPTSIFFKCYKFCGQYRVFELFYDDVANDHEFMGGFIEEVQSLAMKRMARAA